MGVNPQNKRQIISFGRESSGLVNLESYSPYLPDPPDQVPVMLPKDYKGGWVHQHVYFRRPVWRQEGLPEDKKDMNKVFFMNISYNQVIMRRNEEVKLHQDHENHVEPPPDETIQQALEDYRNLDRAGAASIGKWVSLHPETQPQLSLGTGVIKSAMVPLPERAQIFDAQIDSALEDLADPLVLHPRIVTSALKRMSILLNDGKMQTTAEARLEEDPIYYPLRLRSLRALYFMSNDLLKEVCQINPIAA